MDSLTHLISLREPPRFVLQAWLDACARRFPFGGLILAILVSNFAGSVFSFTYNKLLIVDRILDKPQQDAFWDEAAPLYNLLAYPLCIAALFYVIRPVRDCLSMLRRGEPIDPAFLQFCRCRRINGRYYDDGGGEGMMLIYRQRLHGGVLVTVETETAKKE